MSEEDRLVPNKLTLWYDCETSDLDFTSLTVLEMAWTVTGSDLIQKTPVRSRLCAFVPSGAVVITPVIVPEWYNVSAVVQGMHEDSGLVGAFERAKYHEIVRSVEAHDRLILDSLFEAGWDGESKVVLAGSGIAAFDTMVFASCCSVLPSVCHYRSADASVAAELLGVPVPKSIEQVLDLLNESPPLPDGVLCEEFGIESPVWIQIGDLEGQKLHRAGMDVVVSLLLARSLRSRLQRTPS